MSTSNPAVPPSEYLFKVEGLHCANCIQKVKRLEGPERSWETISVDLGKQLLTVVPRPHFDTDEFQKAVSDLGFSIRNIRISKKLKELQKQENRWFLARLGIAGAFAGNIMLIAFALYSGADQTEWRLPLQWLSFVLFLPVLFFSGWPFLKNGFQSLRRMQSSIDLPIAVALVGGTSLSFYNLLANSTYIYFDSLGILVFLILSTRYLVYRVQVNHLEPVSVKDFLGKTAFFKLHNQSERVGFEELEKGNLLELNEGDAVPADGILESKIAEFDTSMITGEALPQKIKQFEAVYSGSKVLTSGVLVRLTKGFQNSRAMLLISSINKAMNQKTPLTSFTDKAAQILTSLVVFCGSLFFIFYFSIDSSAAVNRTLALLVIACPCALAIATPLSLSLGIRKAFKKGIIIKKPEAIEKLKS
ncbi:MAG: cation-translocating P-type ATPase, partial [Bdellovibrionales bacterium]|nr:cation-translocating P-type ATPase [Bdellovibrionales bacterium]